MIRAQWLGVRVKAQQWTSRLGLLACGPARQLQRAASSDLDAALRGFLGSRQLSVTVRSFAVAAARWGLLPAVLLDGCSVQRLSTCMLHRKASWAAGS